MTYDAPITHYTLRIRYIATPDELITCERQYAQPAGILWDQLGDKLNEVPVLLEMR